MTRSAARRSSAVQAEKSPPPPSTEPRPEGSPSAGEAGTASPWYWRFALFLWGTSFAFLLLYEWLAALLKM